MPGEGSNVIQQRLGDGLLLAGLHQCQTRFIEAFAMAVFDQRRPHAAGSAENQEAVWLQVACQGEAEEWSFLFLPVREAVACGSVTSFRIELRTAEKTDEGVHPNDSFRAVVIF